MKLTQIKKIGLALAIMMTVTTAQAYDKSDAQDACVFAIANEGRYAFASNLHTVDKGYHSYKITGTVEAQSNHSKHRFTCDIRHKELVNWRVDRHAKSSDKNAAIAAGAGILALAVIAAAANDEKHKDHDKGASPFDDMKYLKKQCKQNIRHHINRDDQPIKRILLDTVHLHNRTLVGEGGVLFKRGGGSDISYRCEFDRQGRIYDGHYRFH